MTHDVALWLGRFFLGGGLAAFVPSKDRQPMQIEVERLSDHAWRELGFLRPRRIGEEPGL